MMSAGRDQVSDSRGRRPRWQLWLGGLMAGVCLGAVFAMVSTARGTDRQGQRASGGWETAFEEDFAGGIGPGWMVLDANEDEGEYTWGSTSYLSRSADHSAWCVGGGADGGGLVAGEDVYPDSVDSWLIYGPIELDDALDAYLEFHWWLETEVAGDLQKPGAAVRTLEGIDWRPRAGDWFGWCVLTAELDLAGARCTYVSGSTRTWAKGAMPLHDFVPGRTDATESIWIAFRFISDEDGVAGRGAFVDDVTLRVRRVQRVFLPLMRRDPAPTGTPTPTATPTPTPSTPVPVHLRNGGFEADWGEEESNRALVIEDDGLHERYIGNIFTPPSWTTWFDHRGAYAQPEVTDTVENPDPRRTRTGQRAMRLFTSGRIHSAGFLQTVEVQAGIRLRLSAYAHAWSNHKDDDLFWCWNCGGRVRIPPGEWSADCSTCGTGINRDCDLVFPHPSNGLWSEGAGFECFSAEEHSEELNSELENFTFRLGIDPAGGVDPDAETVVWGRRAHIYNCYDEVPPVEVVAEDDTVTVFLRSRTLWPFKHNDAYWDDVTLEVIP